jgi:hypothetical protein
LHHPAGHDDHVDSDCLDAVQHLERPLPESSVLPDQRVIEIGRDNVDVAGKSCGKLDQECIASGASGLCTNSSLATARADQRHLKRHLKS